ncbi:unnamed protein product [Cylindrotheca closterium]|uniref:VPS9 domain-containing protein n=1 Tax=Cylindrotheca closterium TaxID=2856 RepID=A0AAD2CB18_9STRA|nr:unnamed protein product [Cylindrotheca closterium]
MAEANIENEEPQSTISSKEEDNEPMNPALTEPDAMAIAQRAESSAAPTVSPRRKKDLLVQSRKDRRKWIQMVPLPYTQARDPTNVWSLDDRLNGVQSSLACKRLSSATKVLSELYGLESNTKSAEEVAQRVEALIQPFNTDEALLDGSPEVLTEALSKDNSEIVKHYHEFWSKLLNPECAMLVQGMRNYIRNLKDITDMEKLAKSLQTYLDSTFETITTHVAWNDQLDEYVGRSLESCVYGHAKGHLDTLEWNTLFTMEEKDWIDRLEKLQFLTASHLEIKCLEDPNLKMDEILKGPIEAMLAIDRYFSPFEKLQCVLAVYKGVNESLTEALNQSQGDEKTLPSADDVLPTIILTVLKAKPSKMFRSLQFIDTFATSENMRGEAGYAYTNLYGAVQFLHDLDMDKPNFSISTEDFRKGIDESMSKMKQKTVESKEEKISAADSEPSVVEISVQDVRNSRQNGDEIDLVWALERQQQHLAAKALKEDDDGASPFSVSLPSGFNRTYSFLGTKPEDIRISDLPHLLQEYKMLAHVTEELLGERAALLAADKKKRVAQRKNNVEDILIGQTGNLNKK